MKRTKRTGAALVLVIAVLVVTLVMAAYSIDVAYMQLVRTELRAATDAAARAGAEALSREDSTEAAVTAAIAAAAKNKVGHSGLSIAAADIEIGRANQDKSGRWQFVAGDKPYSAVRVYSQKRSPLTLGGITGRREFIPERVSTAAFAVNEICPGGRPLAFHVFRPKWCRLGISSWNACRTARPGRLPSTRYWKPVGLLAKWNQCLHISG